MFGFRQFKPRGANVSHVWNSLLPFVNQICLE